MVDVVEPVEPWLDVEDVPALFDACTIVAAAWEIAAYGFVVATALGMRLWALGSDS